MDTLLGYDNLTVFVEPAVRANSMRKLGFAALRTSRTRRRVDTVVVAAAMMRADTPGSLLRYCHFSSYLAGASARSIAFTCDCL